MDLLLTPIARGDEAAFSGFFHLYKDKVYSVALKLTQSEFLAEEVVQEVFLKIWARRSLMNEIVSIDDYVFIMARNQVYTALRRQARRRTAEGVWHDERPLNAVGPESELAAKEYGQVLEMAISELPPQQKQVYLLSREDNLKREEIAEILNLSPETVKTHLARATRHIRAFSMARLSISISLLLSMLLLPLK